MRIFGYPVALLQESKDSQGSGSVSDPAGSGQSEAKDSTEGKKSEETSSEKEGTKPTTPPKDQPVTPAILKGVLDYQDRSTRETFQKLLKEQEKGFQTRLEKLEKVLASGEKQGKKAEETPPEIVELRREVDEFRQKEAKLTEALEASKRRDSQYRFETQVKAALTRHGCKKPEEAYYVLAHRLTHDEDGNRIFAVVDGEYGREELELDNYISREVKENIIPEFFHGMVLSGSAAGGDSVDGEGKWKFTKEQIFDNPEFYAAHQKEIEQALQDGRVKGVPRPQN